MVEPALVLATATLAVPTVDVADAGCNTDADCNLNGLCMGLKGCQCDAWWAGSQCSELRLGAVDPAGGYQVGSGAVGSSWGATMLRVDGVYHLFAAEWTQHCGIEYWSPNSRIVRATSHSGVPPAPARPPGFARTRTSNCRRPPPNRPFSSPSPLSRTRTRCPALVVPHSLC